MKIKNQKSKIKIITELWQITPFNPSPEGGIDSVEGGIPPTRIHVNLRLFPHIFTVRPELVEGRRAPFTLRQAQRERLMGVYSGIFSIKLTSNRRRGTGLCRPRYDRSERLSTFFTQFAKVR
jgi:hypothetical protein